MHFVSCAYNFRNWRLLCTVWSESHLILQLKSWCPLFLPKTHFIGYLKIEVTSRDWIRRNEIFAVYSTLDDPWQTISTLFPVQKLIEIEFHSLQHHICYHYFLTLLWILVCMARNSLTLLHQSSLSFWDFPSPLLHLGHAHPLQRYSLYSFTNFHKFEFYHPCVFSHVPINLVLHPLTASDVLENFRIALFSRLLLVFFTLLLKLKGARMCFSPYFYCRLQYGKTILRAVPLQCCWRMMSWNLKMLLLCKNVKRHLSLSQNSIINN